MATKWQLAMEHATRADVVAARKLGYATMLKGKVGDYRLFVKRIILK